MQIKKISRTQRGFSLVELVAVVAVIAILAAIGIAGLSYFSGKSAEEKARVQLSLIGDALQSYRLDRGEFPSMDELFAALSGNEPEGDGQVYLSDLNPATNPQGLVAGENPNFEIVDPFGTALFYRRGDEPGALNPDFDLCSAGPDRLFGTADDICL